MIVNYLGHGKTQTSKIYSCKLLFRNEIFTFNKFTN
jgi:hypothetical protein